MYTYFSHPVTNCDIVLLTFYIPLCKVSKAHIKAVSEKCAGMQIVHSSG